MSYFEDYVRDGLCCAGCGAFIDGGEPGHVRYCSARCAGDAFKEDDRHQPRVPAFREPPRPKIKADQVECPDCGKRVKKVGLRHHQLDKHGAVSA